MLTPFQLQMLARDLGHLLVCRKLQQYVHIPEAPHCQAFHCKVVPAKRCYPVDMVNCYVPHMSSKALDQPFFPGTGSSKSCSHTQHSCADQRYLNFNSTATQTLSTVSYLSSRQLWRFNLGFRYFHTRIFISAAVKQSLVLPGQWLHSNHDRPAEDHAILQHCPLSLIFVLQYSEVTSVVSA